LHANFNLAWEEDYISLDEVDLFRCLFDKISSLIEEVHIHGGEGWSPADILTSLLSRINHINSLIWYCDILTEEQWFSLLHFVRHNGKLKKLQLEAVFPSHDLESPFHHLGVALSTSRLNSLVIRDSFRDDEDYLALKAYIKTDQYLQNIIIDVSDYETVSENAHYAMEIVLKKRELFSK
jgi:hypothetical protein